MSTDQRKAPYYEVIASTLAAVSDKLITDHPELDGVICVPVYRLPNQALSPAVLRFATPEVAQSAQANLRAALQLNDALLLQTQRVRQILNAYDTAAAQMASNIAAQQQLLQENESKLNGTHEPGTDGRGSGVETTPVTERPADGQ